MAQLRDLIVTGAARFVNGAYFGGASTFGSATRPVWWNNGFPQATTYSLSATLNAGSANRLAYYSGANAVSASSHYASATQVGINITNIDTIGSRALYVNGTSEFSDDIYANKSIRNLAVGGGLYWNPYVESATDNSDAASITLIKSGIAGGTELQIKQANDQNDVINLVAPYYIYLNSKRAFTVNDSWLRINDTSTFTSGIYTGTSILRTDNQLQVGNNGANFYAKNTGDAFIQKTLGIAGVNIGYALYVNGKANIGDETAATSASTGALTVNGGIGVSSNSYFGGNVTATLFLGNAAGHKLGYRHLDAGNPNSFSDSRLYIGYGALYPTRSIGFYNTKSDNTGNTLWAEINDNGFYTKTRFGVNGQNTSYNFYVNGTSYFTGAVNVNSNLTALQFIGNLTSAYYGSDTADTSGWYKVFTKTTTGYNDDTFNLIITSGYNRQATGLLHVHVRSNNTTTLVLQTLKWMYRYGFNESDVRVVLDGNNWSLYVYQNNVQHGRIQVVLVTKAGTSGNHTMTLTNNNTRETTAPTGTAASDGGRVYYAAQAGNADTLDGYHENKFLRYRDAVSGSGGTSHSNSLWSQIGIRQYNNALPDAMGDNATYTYGAVISFPGEASRLDLWYNHQTSANGNGLRYRTGWNDDKKAWATILDTANYTGTLDSRYALISTLQARGLIKDYGIQTSNATGWTNTLAVNQFSVYTNWWDSGTYMPYIYGSGIMIPHLDGNYRSFLHFQCSLPKVWVGWVNKTSTSTPTWKYLWAQGDAVTSAVWNDYAECRKSDSQEPGYVMFEKGDDSLSKTIERLQHFAGIVSDTWGFSQGETADAKTNIAVAGRVLAYPYRDRNEYKPGDCVCAAPGGKVDIMTREEIAQYPDRIVGTVSCVPEYEEWGGGELADRDPVKVNGRIWIKVK